MLNPHDESGRLQQYDTLEYARSNAKKVQPWKTLLYAILGACVVAIPFVKPMTAERGLVLFVLGAACEFVAVLYGFGSLRRDGRKISHAILGTVGLFIALLILLGVCTFIFWLFWIGFR